jgi:hypothetical protein
VLSSLQPDHILLDKAVSKIRDIFNQPRTQSRGQYQWNVPPLQESVRRLIVINEKMKSLADLALGILNPAGRLPVGWFNAFDPGHGC